MDDYALTWTEPAAADLEAAVRLAARRDAADGEALRDGVFASVETLARLPFLGPVYEPEPSGRTREITFRQYRIFYRVIEADRRVEIVAIWHAARKQGPRL